MWRSRVNVCPGCGGTLSFVKDQRFSVKLNALTSLLLCWLGLVALLYDLFSILGRCHSLITKGGGRKFSRYSFVNDCARILGRLATSSITGLYDLTRKSFVDILIVGLGDSVVCCMSSGRWN